MALRTVRLMGDEILNKQCRPIRAMTPRLQELIGDMFETMYAEEGAGLAAPQVGVLKQVVVVDVGEHPWVFINPTITETSGEQTGDEACLSLPGKMGEVTRPSRITVEALDENMEPFTLEAEDFLARAICHEVDHLQGVLYVERVKGELFDVETEGDQDE